MATEPIDLPAHPGVLPRGAPPRAVPNPPVDDPGDPPTRQHPRVVLLFDVRGDARSLLHAHWWTWEDAWPSRYATVLVTGMALRLDLETGVIAMPRAARRRVDRWVSTALRVVPLWAWVTDLGAPADETHTPSPWTGSHAPGEDVPHAR